MVATAKRLGRRAAAFFAITLSLGSGVIATKTGSPPDAPRVSTRVGALKPLIRGLIDRHDISPSSHFGAIQAFVVQVRWANLQPERGGPIVEGNAIDRALSQVRTLNRENPDLVLKIRLRVYAGIHAPEWMKNLGGQPLVATNPANDLGSTIGHFWTDGFGRAYLEFQTKLAARYDQALEIREVVIARCTTVFGEPFLRQIGDRATVEALLDAGFTPETDHRCHREEIDAHKVWTRTRSISPSTPTKSYHDVCWTVASSAAQQVDEDFTEDMMRYCRSALGGRCVLKNNFIGWLMQPAYEGLYASANQLSPPLAFQTTTKARGRRPEADAQVGSEAAGQFSRAFSRLRRLC